MNPGPDNCNFFDIHDRNKQWRLAQCMQLLYNDPNNTVVPELFCELGTSVYPNGFNQWPGFWISQFPGYWVVGMAGTTTFIEFALEAIALSLGPDNFGLWGSIPLWRNAAFYLANHISTFYPSIYNDPILLVGHSYGGAAMCNLAALYHQANPDREVKLMTFGCPKPGDQRLIDILADIDQIHIGTPNDVVPNAPFSFGVLGALAGLVPPNILSAWARFKPVQGAYTIGYDHVLRPGRIDTTPLDILVAIMAWAFSGGSSPAIPDHSMDVYADLLS